MNNPPLNQEGPCHLNEEDPFIPENEIVDAENQDEQDIPGNVMDNENLVNQNQDEQDIPGNVMDNENLVNLNQEGPCHLNEEDPLIPENEIDDAENQDEQDIPGNVILNENLDANDAAQAVAVAAAAANVAAQAVAAANLAAQAVAAANLAANVAAQAGNAQSHLVAAANIAVFHALGCGPRVRPRLDDGSTSFSSTSRAPTISGAHSVCRGVLPTLSRSAPPCQDGNPLFAANVDRSASGVNSVGMGSLSTSSSSNGTAAAAAAGSSSGVNLVGIGSLSALSSSDGTSEPQKSMDVAPCVAANADQSAAAPNTRLPPYSPSSLSFSSTSPALTLSEPLSVGGGVLSTLYSRLPQSAQDEPDLFTATDVNRSEAAAAAAAASTSGADPVGMGSSSIVSSSVGTAAAAASQSTSSRSDTNQEESPKNRAELGTR